MFGVMLSVFVAVIIFAGVFESHPVYAEEYSHNYTATNTTGWAGKIWVEKFTGLDVGHRVYYVSYYDSVATGHVRAKIYQDDGIGGYPSTLLNQTESMMINSIGVVDVPITAIVPPSGNLWVAFEFDDNATALYGNMTGVVSSSTLYTNHVYGDGPNPFGAATISTQAPFMELSSGCDPRSFRILTVGDQIQGVPFNITIQALDAGNNLCSNNFDFSNPPSFYLYLYITNSVGGITPTTSNPFFGIDTLVQSVTINNVGTGTITVSGTPNGHFATGTSNSFTVAPTEVDDTDPAVLGPITAPVNPIQINTQFTASASFTDDADDTHTASWNWGDGITVGTVTEFTGSGSVQDTHTYTTPGVYTITLTVNNSDGATATTQFQFVVAYDPNGGFVTGGGWINSQQGAYAAEPLLTGKATFGFNSKYQYGTTIPTGNTEFNFKIANLNFHSTNYDWLVIAGAKAQYKGTGTINENGSYHFMLTATDSEINGGGNFDKFRMKITDSNGGMIYDNLLNAPDSTDPTTALGAGNIVIHKS